MLGWIAYLPIFIMFVLWIWLFGFSSKKEKDSKEEEFKNHFIGKMVDYIPDYINGMPRPKKQTYIIYDMNISIINEFTVKNDCYSVLVYNIKTNEKEVRCLTRYELEAIRLGCHSNFKFCSN